jgi:IclR family pca regulon transcriptional regulator
VGGAALSTEIPRERPATSNPQARARRSSNETVQGLRRGFAVIKAFTAESPNLSISQVAGRTGLTRAVARRYLLTLEDLGCVVQMGSSFTLTPRLLDLGFTYLATLDVAKVAQPVMEGVVAKLHESCSVAVLDSHDIVYVARIAARRIMSINLAVGSRLPAHATSMGKILLAHLSPEGLDAYFQTAPLQRLTKRTICDEVTLRAALKEVRVRGWAINDQDCEDGIRTLAAPLFDRSNTVVAAINISAHAARVSMRELKRSYLPVLLDAGHQVSKTLGANIDSTIRRVGVP